MVQTTADVSGLLFLYLFSVAVVATQVAIQAQTIIQATAIAVASVKENRGARPLLRSCFILKPRAF